MHKKPGKCWKKHLCICIVCCNVNFCRIPLNDKTKQGQTHDTRHRPEYGVFSVTNFRPVFILSNGKVRGMESTHDVVEYIANNVAVNLCLVTHCPPVFFDNGGGPHWRSQFVCGRWPDSIQASKLLFAVYPCFGFLLVSRLPRQAPTNLQVFEKMCRALAMLNFVGLVMSLKEGFSLRLGVQWTTAYSAYPSKTAHPF